MMNDLNAMEPSVRRRIEPARPGTWPAVRKGVLLAVLAAFVASLGVAVVWCLTPILTGVMDYLDWGFSFGVGMIIFFVALIPAAIGGCIDALALCWQATRYELTTGRSVLTGAAVGLVSSYVVLLIVQSINFFAAPPDTLFLTLEIQPEELPFVLVFVATCLAIGCWHGWKMGRYIRRRA